MDQRFILVGTAGVTAAILAGAILYVRNAPSGPPNVAPAAAVLATPDGGPSGRIEAAPLEEKATPGGFLIGTPLLPIYGVALPPGRKLEWWAMAASRGEKLTIAIEINATGECADDWRQLRTSTLTLTDGTHRLDLKTEPFYEPKRGAKSATLLASTDISALSLLARAKTPRLIFSAAVGEIGPSGGATCKAMVRRAVVAHETAKGTTPELAAKIAAMLAGDND